MQSSSILAIKKFVNRAIFLGVIGAAVAFLFAISLPKYYLVVGKIVVFPSGSGTAEKNLSQEVGNTIQIISSSAFKTNTFQGTAGNFAYAKQMGNSSTIAVAFYAQNNEQTIVQDSIVRVPMAVADYARDLYGGSPFKYKLLSDPEISVGPVKPNLAKYLGWGFGVGVLASFLYWFLFEFLRIPAEKEEEILIEADEEKIEKPLPSEPAEKKIGGGKIVMENDRPHFVPSESSEIADKKIISPISQPAVDTAFLAGSTNGAAPENLPFVGDELPPVPQSEEPTDEEVKDRLNRLMRGEL